MTSKVYVIWTSLVMLARYRRGIASYPGSFSWRKEPGNIGATECSPTAVVILVSVVTCSGEGIKPGTEQNGTGSNLALINSSSHCTISNQRLWGNLKVRCPW